MLTGVSLVRGNMKLLRKLTTMFDSTVDLFSILAGMLLVFVMLAVCAHVVLRYFLGRPTIWVVEISEVILLYITFLGTAWLLRREGHVKIEILLGRLHPRTQAWLNIMMSAIGAIICLVVVWYGVQVTWQFFHRDVLTPTVLALPRAWIIAIIPIGSFLLALQFVKRALRYWGTRKEINL